MNRNNLKLRLKKSTIFSVSCSHAYAPASFGNCTKRRLNLVRKVGKVDIAVQRQSMKRHKQCHKLRIHIHDNMFVGYDAVVSIDQTKLYKYVHGQVAAQGVI